MLRRICWSFVVVAALFAPASGTLAADVVNVANVSRTLFSLPLWVAQHRGFMKDEGLETTSHILDNAEKINAALRSGTMQIAMGTPEAVMIDAYKGGTLRIIAGNTGKLPHFIIARPADQDARAICAAPISASCRRRKARPTWCRTSPRRSG